MEVIPDILYKQHYMKKPDGAGADNSSLITLVLISSCANGFFPAVSGVSVSVRCSDVAPLIAC